MSNKRDSLEPLCETDEENEKLFSKSEIKNITVEISCRILEAFQYLPNREIAFLLECNVATVKSFLQEGELPSTEILLGIHRVTGISIDWILTGKGAKYRSFGNLVSSLNKINSAPHIYGGRGLVNNLAFINKK